MYSYCEIITDSITNRGNVVELPYSNLLLDYYGKEVREGYHSVYMHTKEYADYHDADGGKSQYSGNVAIDYLYWDMDSVNLLYARNHAVELVKRLTSDFGVKLEAILIYFSGGKGFHILFPCLEIQGLAGHPDLPIIVKHVCSTIAAGIDSFDAKIYDGTRIFRTPNSKHGRSGLYKIELTYDELCGVIDDVDIVKLSSVQRKPLSHSKPLPNTKIGHLIDEALKTRSVKVKHSSPNFTVNELLESIANGFPEGQRNSGLTSVAGILHRRNFDKDLIAAILFAINNNGEKPLAPSEIINIARSVDRYSVDSAWIEPKSDEILTMKDAADAWYAIMQRSGYTSFGEKYGHINKHLAMFFPGNCAAIVGSAGTGKTTIGMDLCNNQALHDKGYGLLISLEMPRSSVFFRAATMEATPDVNNMVDAVAVGNMLMSNKALRTTIEDKWKNLLIVDKEALSIEQIELYYNIAQEKTNQQIRHLLVDYGQLLAGTEDHLKTAVVARGIKSLAKKLQIRATLLLQLNKTAGDGRQEVYLDNIEGTGAWGQAMDFVIAAWQDMKDLSRIHCKVAKNRWGERDARFDLVRTGMQFRTEDAQYVASCGRW